MSGGAIFQLVLQALVLLVWAILIFRLIFTLRDRAAAETGATPNGRGQFMHQFGQWLKSPQDRQERNAILFLTFVLIAMTLSSALLSPGG